MVAIIRLQADSLVAALAAISENLDKELGIVAWKAGKKAKSIVAKEVTKELAVKQAVVKKHVTVKRLFEGSSAISVRIDKSKRIPLRDFKARQIKSGVSYKISHSQGRKVVPKAFQGPKPGRMNVKWRGRVFKREGKRRLPIYQLFGPSPWGVMQKHKMKPDIKAEMRIEIRKQLAERIRVKTLKQAGVI